jgi:hypothetical protein
MCIESTFHPQDIVAMGFSVAAMACALRRRWIAAGILIALAFLSQQFALLIAIPLFVFAPKDRRIHFAGAAVLATALIVFPIVAVTPGNVTRELVVGTASSGGIGGTVVWNLQLRGAPLFLISRVLPPALSFLSSVIVLRRLGLKSATEPTVLSAVISLSLAFRLVFEQALFGYYFMALAVALTLLAIASGHIRSSFVAWLAMVTLVYSVGPLSLAFFRESWSSGARVVLPLILICVALALILWRVLLGGPVFDLIIWAGLIVGTLVEWGIDGDPLSHPLSAWLWQVVLVLSGVCIAAGPLLERLKLIPRPSRLVSAPSSGDC